MKNDCGRLERLFLNDACLHECKLIRHSGALEIFFLFVMISRLFC